MKAMRGHTLGEPRTLLQQVVTEIPVSKPQENQLLIRVGAVGLNPDVEPDSAGVAVRVPFAPGGDAAGVVEAVGAGVKEFQVGQRVYTCDLGYGGHYGEFMVVDATLCFPLPESLSFIEGAALPCSYLTAMRALTYGGNAQKGQTVLIHGATGGVGLAAAQIACALGLTVLGTAGSDAGMTLIQSNGVSRAFNHRSKDYVKEIMDYTKGQIDLIVEVAAHDNLDKDCDLIGKNGTIVVIGCQKETQIDCRKLMGKEAKIKGIWLPDVASLYPQEWQQMGQELNRLVAQGKLRPVVDTVYQMAEAGKCHEHIMQRKDGSKGKFIIQIQNLDHIPVQKYRNH